MPEPDRNDDPTMSTKPKAPFSKLIPWFAIALVVIVVDQFTKTLVLQKFLEGDGIIVTHFFNLVRVHNHGAAFSFLASGSGWQRWFFIGIGAAATVFIVAMLRSHGGQKLFSWALSLILGGALGNVVDRLLHGYVVDFIQLHAAGRAFPSFNIADSAITLGAAFLILDEILRVRRAAPTP
jgi:signal peptidase II